MPRSALVLPESLDTLVKKDLADKFVKEFESVYVPAPLEPPHETAKKIEDLQLEKRIIVVSFHDFDELRQEYAEFVAHLEGDLPERTDEEVEEEANFAALLVITGRINADLIAPDREPYTSLKNELQRRGWVAEA